MSIYGKLSAADCNLIETYISYYGGCDASEITLKSPLEHILRFWSKNKNDLCNVLGGEVIVSKEVSFAKPIDIIADELWQKLLGYNCAGRPFVENFTAWVDSRSTRNNHWDLLALVGSDYLSTNTYTGQSFSVPTPDGKVIAINNGCKVSKVLGKLASTFHINGYEDFRLTHSLCLNQKLLKGELCLSIHPLDYMTMSDNACGWDSCMSWQQPGDYRMGTVEMMNSPYIVVAYLRASENMPIDSDLFWNSKKWRQLFVVTPELITGIRQYPYVSDELSGISLQWLRELAQKNAGWGPYEDTTVKINNCETNIFASIEKEVYIEFYTHLMYNDFSRNHLAYISADIPEHFSLCFSGETECMRCGDLLDSNYHDDTSLLTCEDCEHIVRCMECGERINPDSAVYLADGAVCQYCYENYYNECHLCESIVHESDRTTVYIRDGKEITPYYIKVCSDCLYSDTFAEKFGTTKVDYSISRWSPRTVVDIENLTLSGFEYFDIWPEDNYNKLKAKIKPDTEDEN